MKEEIDSLKESYRRSIADYEREKTTKEALQKCVDAFQKGNNLRSNDNDIAHIRPRSTRPGQDGSSTPQQSRGQSIAKPVKECRFFNSKSGCRNRDSCRFPHVTKAPCKLGLSCKIWKCEFNHQTPQVERDLGNVNGERFHGRQQASGRNLKRKIK